ncbi:MAG: peptidase S53, partial [Burkholderiales bacterium]|nr:peptidase S53 [Burkholderiales bacterium]
MTKRTILAGTRPVARARQRVKAVDHSEVLEVLLLLRDRGASPPDATFALGGSSVHDRKHLDPVELQALSGASETDLEEVRQFAADHELQVIRVDPGARTIVVRGSVGNVNRAFSTELHHYRAADQDFRSHENEISVPKELGEIVTGVFGLDDRSVARRPRFAAGSGPAPPPVDENTKRPSAFTDLYAFPDDATGKGQCIAILEFQGGFEKTKLESYLQRLGVKAPKIIVREIGRGRNDPRNEPNTINPDVEVYMDLEIVASTAPDATIVVYFGENNEMGWVETLRAAVFDATHRPAVMSISWGWAEEYWKADTIKAIDDAFQKAAALGITVCCSSGDLGVFEANDPPEPFTVAFPASSPYVLACGGTRLETLPGGSTKESVWNQSSTIGMTSGGGVSRVYDLPPFQSGSDIPERFGTAQSGRGIPDVAANASSLTGYMVWADDTAMSMGGT